MSASPSAATVPPHRIGAAVFRAIDGRLCGLHIKNASVFAVSILQEPLTVFIGSFRFTRLAAVTSAATMHLPTLSESFIAAFESGPAAAVMLVHPPPRSSDRDDQLAISGAAPARDHDAGHGEIHAAKQPLSGSSSPTAIATKSEQGATSTATSAPVMVIDFTCFGVDHRVSLTLQRVASDGDRDPFVWSIVMDLFRTILKQSAQLTRRSGGAASIRVPGRQEGDAEAASSARPRTANGHPVLGAGGTMRVRRPRAAAGLETFQGAATPHAAASPSRAPWWPALHTNRGPTTDARPSDKGDATVCGGGPLYSNPPAVLPTPTRCGPRSVGAQTGGSARRGQPASWGAAVAAAPREELQRQLLAAHARIAELEGVSPRDRAAALAPPSTASVHDGTVPGELSKGRPLPTVCFSGRVLDHPLQRSISRK